MPDPATRIADEELMRIVNTGDPLAEMYRSIVGTSVRLHIPLRDPIQMRQVATVLRVLASKLESQSMSKGSAYEILFSQRSAVTAANRAINPNYGKRSNANNGP